jgi:hypothetical protein
VVRFMNRPRIKRIYYGILDRMTRDGGPFTREFLTPYAQLLQQAGVNPGNTINFVNSKRAALRRVVESVVTESLDFSIDTNGGAAITSDAPVVTIEGMAPVDVRRIVVLKDGQISEDPGDVIEAAFSDENVLGWRYDAELPNGTTNLTFVAYGFDDEELGTQTIEVTVSAAARFVRGDANSSGKLEVSDAIQTLLYVGGLTATGECQDAMDSDDNGMIDLTDAVAVLEYLFLQGPDLAPPFPGPGADPTADNLGCGTN